MRKLIGFTLAALFTLTLSAAAEEAKGTVKTIDRADHSIVLDDGTRLTVSESQLTTLTPGEQVRAMYQTNGGKNIVTDLDPRGIGSDFRGTTSWGAAFGTEIDSVQSE